MMDEAMDEAKASHKEVFDTFCQKNYLSTSEKVTSKTISLVKAEKVRQVVRGIQLECHSSSFKHWVKKTKKFEILNFPDLNLRDVLCLPSKTKVSFSMYIMHILLIKKTLVVRSGRLFLS